jgi:hypothetical protein
VIDVNKEDSHPMNGNQEWTRRGLNKGYHMAKETMKCIKERIGGISIAFISAKIQV